MSVSWSAARYRNRHRRSSPVSRCPSGRGVCLPRFDTRLNPGTRTRRPAKQKGGSCFSTPIGRLHPTRPSINYLIASTPTDTRVRNNPTLLYFGERSDDPSRSKRSRHRGSLHFGWPVSAGKGVWWFHDSEHASVWKLSRYQRTTLIYYGHLLAQNQG